MKKNIKNIENTPAVLILIVAVAILAVFLTGREALSRMGVLDKKMPTEVREITTIDGVTLKADYHKNAEGRIVYTYTAQNMSIKEFKEKYKIGKYIVQGFDVSEENGIEKINEQDDKIEITTIRKAEYPDLTSAGFLIQNIENGRNEKITFKLLVED